MSKGEGSVDNSNGPGSDHLREDAVLQTMTWYFVTSR